MARTRLGDGSQRPSPATRGTIALVVKAYMLHSRRCEVAEVAVDRGPPASRRRSGSGGRRRRAASGPLAHGASIAGPSSGRGRGSAVVAFAGGECEAASHERARDASKAGSTREIAQAVANALRARGLEVAVAEPDDVESVDAYDAVVLGSAVYSGHWLEPAKEFVRRSGRSLAERPVWLFSSGPVGDPSRKLVEKMSADPLDLPELAAIVRPRGHRMFAGRLERAGLPRAQRLSLRLFRGLEGDFRDWREIEAWGAEIADALKRGS